MEVDYSKNSCGLRLPPYAVRFRHRPRMARDREGKKGLLRAFGGWVINWSELLGKPGNSFPQGHLFFFLSIIKDGHISLRLLHGNALFFWSHLPDNGKIAVEISQRLCFLLGKGEHKLIILSSV